MLEPRRDRRQEGAMSGRSHRRHEALAARETRLSATLSAIHDALHRGSVDEAHEHVHAALKGEARSQPNLSIDDSARVQRFSERFNEMSAAMGLRACALVLLPSSRGDGAFSVQVFGETHLLRLVEERLGVRRTV
jgi:hypothetical protein